ncbi:MAG: YlxR family protein [Eubacterium sp.]|nr:YlxR family protein [Eubacterium sp.]
MAVRKIPQRKCAGCEQMKEKKQLIRVVHTPEDEFLLDLTGKKSGRGTYICKSRECFEAARKKRGLERSLKCAVPPEVYDRLLEQLESEEE